MTDDELRHEVKRLHFAGLSIKEVAGELGIDPHEAAELVHVRKAKRKGDRA